MTLGPVGMVVHAPNISSAAKGEKRNNLDMIECSVLLAGRRLRRHALPTGGTFRHVGVIGFRRRAVVPVPLSLRGRGCDALLDIYRRRVRLHRRRRIGVSRIGVSRIAVSRIAVSRIAVIAGGVERKAKRNAKAHAAVTVAVTVAMTAVLRHRSTARQGSE